MFIQMSPFAKQNAFRCSYDMNPILNTVRQYVQSCKCALTINAHLHAMHTWHFMYHKNTSTQQISQIANLTVVLYLVQVNSIFRTTVVLEHQINTSCAIHLLHVTKMTFVTVTKKKVLGKKCIDTQTIILKQKRKSLLICLAWKDSLIIYSMIIYKKPSVTLKLHIIQD